MEKMSAAFPTRPLVQLDNIIVYTGPPAESRKIRPPRPTPTPREREDFLPPVAMRTVGACGENGSRTNTPTLDCGGFTSTFPTPITGEPANREGLFDTSTRTETNDYHSVADMAFCTAIWPGLWGDVDGSIDAGNARNESPNSPFCSTVDIYSACASAVSSAASLRGHKQRTPDNIQVATPAASSLGPEMWSRSLSPTLEVMRAHEYSADTTAPTNGSTGRASPDGSVRAAAGVVRPTLCEFPDVSRSVCVALEAEPPGWRTLISEDLEDNNWVHDQDAVTPGDASLVLPSDQSCSLSGQEDSFFHEPVGVGRSACEENGSYDSSDDDIVPWIPKRRRALLVSSASAETRDSGQPSMKRRRQTRTAESAVTSAPRRTASRPAGYSVPAVRSRPQRTNAPTAASAQDEWPVSSRAFESEPTWEVDRIVGSSRMHGKDYYKVLWEPTWEPAESLQGSADTAVAEYVSNRRRRVCWSKSGSK